MWTPFVKAPLQCAADNRRFEAIKVAPQSVGFPVDVAYQGYLEADVLWPPTIRLEKMSDSPLSSVRSERELKPYDGRARKARATVRTKLEKLIILETTGK